MKHPQDTDAASARCDSQKRGRPWTPNPRPSEVLSGLMFTPVDGRYLQPEYVSRRMQQIAQPLGLCTTTRLAAAGATDVVVDIRTARTLHRAREPIGEVFERRRRMRPSSARAVPIHSQRSVKIRHQPRHVLRLSSFDLLNCLHRHSPHIPVGIVGGPLPQPRQHGRIIPPTSPAVSGVALRLRPATRDRNPNSQARYSRRSFPHFG